MKLLAFFLLAALLSAQDSAPAKLYIYRYGQSSGNF